jgi:hypothetical protein
MSTLPVVVTVRNTSNQTTTANAVINVNDVTPVSLFTTQTPAQPNHTDGPTHDYELGMRFSSSVNGTITGIKYWRAASETGTHTGRIWSSTGTLLASVVFTGDTGSGWKTQALASPLAITAGTTYVVSVNANVYYVTTSGGFVSAISNSPLTAPAGGGRFNDNAGVFPNGLFGNENYFRDVVFVPGAAPPLQAPIVSNGSFNVTAGAGTVGTMSATNNPTSWAITAGNAAGYFSISNAGVISSTAAVVAGSYSLTCRATNSAGNGTGMATITVTAAGSFVWPNASNTGIPSGTTLTNYTGPGIINTPGTVIDSKIFPNGIEVTAANVTFRRCLFTGSPAWQLNGDTARDLLVEDCEFRGGVQTILGQGIFRRLNIHSCSIGMTLKDGQSTVTRCYIHDLAGAAGTHFDGIFISGGQTNCLVEDCWIDVPSNGGTANIFIATRWQNSHIVNTTVNHCRLLGGPSFALYNEQTSVATITGTRWTNNEIQRGGYGYWTWTGSVPVRQGNKDAFTGANIDNQ